MAAPLSVRAAAVLLKRQNLLRLPAEVVHCLFTPSAHCDLTGEVSYDWKENFEPLLVYIPRYTFYHCSLVLLVTNCMFDAVVGSCFSLQFCIFVL